MMIMYLLENKLSKTYLLLHFSKTIDHTQEVQIRKQAVATPVRFSDGSRQGLTMEKSTVVVSVPVVVMAETAETDYSSSFSHLCRMQSPRKMLGRVINQGIRELLRSLQYIRSIVLRWQTLFNSGGQLLQLPVWMLILWEHPLCSLHLYRNKNPQQLHPRAILSEKVIGCVMWVQLSYPHCHKGSSPFAGFAVGSETSCGVDNVLAEHVNSNFTLMSASCYIVHFCILWVCIQNFKVWIHVF